MAFNIIDPRILELVEATSFPPVALKIFTMVGNANIDMEEIERTLSMDSVLSARVFKVANSPFFNRGHKADTLSRAVSLIGMNALRTVVLTATLYDVYKPTSPVEKKLWEHALGVSLAASLLAKQTSLAVEHQASTAGLFHDIGKLIIKTAFTRQYDEMADFIDGGSISFNDAEYRTFGVTHTATGVVLAHRWNLGPDYCAVIEWHHGIPDNLTLPAAQRRLIQIISMADEIALYFGIGFRKQVHLEQLPFRQLGLTKTAFDGIIWHLNETFEEYINSLQF
jgi:putative nucleotidyltransferase with HDIG domain